MTTVAPPLVVTKPGVYPDMPEHVYHGDPVPHGSLSSSGARRILPPGCPAKFAYERTHGRRDTTALNFGRVAHAEVLGIGAPIWVIEADSYRTKEARERRDLAVSEGGLPVLDDDYAVIQAMAAALREHPLAGPLLDPDSGVAEQSLFWIDDKAPVWRRARIDWLRHSGDGRLLVPDYKTCACASPDKAERVIQEYGLHQQGAWELDGIRTLGLDPDPVFLLIFQEKEAPYLVSVIEPPAVSMRIGAALNRQAIDLYAFCQAANAWPGYTDTEPAYVGLPAYVENTFLRESR